VEQCQAAADPQIKPADLGGESACRLLSSTTTIVIYYYLARKLTLILPSHGGYRRLSQLGHVGMCVRLVYVMNAVVGSCGCYRDLRYWMTHLLVVNQSVIVDVSVDCITSAPSAELLLLLLLLCLYQLPGVTASVSPERSLTGIGQ